MGKEVCDAVGERPGLAGAGTREDQHGTGFGGHGRELLVVELRAKIDRRDAVGQAIFEREIHEAGNGRETPGRRKENSLPFSTVGCALARNVASKLATHIPDDDEGQDSKGRIKGRAPNLTSRSCHDLDSLRASFGLYHSVFFGPVFPSISKPGYGPQDAQIGKALGAVLFTRTVVDRRTSVFAIGGITMETAPRALAFGFDGVAVLGAIWEAADPLSAFERIQTLCRSGFICDPAAATLVAPIADKSAPTASALPS